MIDYVQNNQCEISTKSIIYAFVESFLFESFSKNKQMQIKSLVSVFNCNFYLTSSSSFEVGLLKSRVRRLYLDFGVEIFWISDTFEFDRTVGPGVLTTDEGKRLVGVDEPNATLVALTWATRLSFVDFVDAKR